MPNPYKNTIKIVKVTNPKKDVSGSHDVFNTERRNHVERYLQIGSITKLRGAGGYVATVHYEDGRREASGEFDTKHQAGHGIKKMFYATEYAAKEAAKAARLAEKALRKVARDAAASNSDEKAA